MAQNGGSSLFGAQGNIRLFACLCSVSSYPFCFGCWSQHEEPRTLIATSVNWSHLKREENVFQIYILVGEHSDRTTKKGALLHAAARKTILETSMLHLPSNQTTICRVRATPSKRGFLLKGPGYFHCLSGLATSPTVHCPLLSSWDSLRGDCARLPILQPRHRGHGRRPANVPHRLTTNCCGQTSWEKGPGQ